MNDGGGFSFNLWHLIFTLGFASHISLCLIACALTQYIMAKVIQYHVTFLKKKDIKWQKIMPETRQRGPKRHCFSVAVCSLRVWLEELLLLFTHKHPNSLLLCLTYAFLSSESHLLKRLFYLFVVCSGTQSSAGVRLHDSLPQISYGAYMMLAQPHTVLYPL